MDVKSGKEAMIYDLKTIKQNINSPMVLMMGGIEKSGLITNHFQVYDVLYDEWWNLNVDGFKRANFAMEVVSNQLYIIGKYTLSH